MSRPKGVKASQGAVSGPSWIRTLLKVLLNIFMIFVTLFALYPLVWMIFSSLKSEKDFANNQLGLPTSFHFDNYARAWKMANMNTSVSNSVFVTVIAVILVLVLSFLIAYILNRYRFTGNRFVYALFLLGMMVPAHSFIIPVYIQFMKLGLLNRVGSLVLINVAFAMPFSIILIENFLNGVPKEIDEAAIIDGTNLYQRLVHVMFPLCRPVIMTVTILQSMWIWNEFPFALTIITDIDKRTLPITLVNFKGEHTIDYTAMFAALVIASIPILVIYAMFSERIMEGMTAGSVKG